MITPEEFIIAGDKITSVSSEWKWQKAIDKKYENPNLPADKQYLL